MRRINDGRVWWQNHLTRDLARKEDYCLYITALQCVTLRSPRLLKGPTKFSGESDAL